jgi:hypothetical protein
VRSTRTPGSATPWSNSGGAMIVRLAFLVSADAEAIILEMAGE